MRYSVHDGIEMKASTERRALQTGTGERANSKRAKINRLNHSVRWIIRLVGR
jgi:hypothetical protein